MTQCTLLYDFLKETVFITILMMLWCTYIYYSLSVIYPQFSRNLLERKWLQLKLQIPVEAFV